MSRESMAGAFLLLLHNQFSGRPRCGADPLRGGLAGAQLAELAIFGRIGVAEGRVHPLDAAPLESARPTAEYVMECVRGQPRHHTVRTWTEKPRRAAAQDDRRRTRRGRRRPPGVRRLRLAAHGSPARARLLRAAAPRARMERMITAPRELDV